MSGSASINRQHVSFAIAGVLFGFLLGFVLAQQMHGGRFGGVVSARAPETMGGQRGGEAAAPGRQAAPSMEMMEQVRQELTALKKAIEADPRNVAALRRLGNLYMDAGMYDKAVEFYQGALKIDPADVELRTDMGTCLRELGQSREALREFRDSVARNPSHWKGWFNIGIVSMYDLGEYQQAEAAFVKVLELNPGSFDMDAVRVEIEKLKAQKAGKAAGQTPS